MLKSPAYIFLPKYRALVLTLVFSAWIAAGAVQAKGQGPISLWPASERYVLIADKAYPGLVLVDLQTGTSIERKEIDNKQPKGIVSCPGCDFIFVSGAPGDFWILHLEDSVEKLLGEKGALGLASSRIEKLDISAADGELVDGRMLIMREGGKIAFIASSDNRAVFRVDFAATPNATVFLKGKKVKPFGLNWDKSGGLLVSMHKRYVWRMSMGGEKLAVYDIKTARCPGALALKPNLRAAVDDPLNENSVLILASNPKSYDAVLWRLTIDDSGKQSCINVAGTIGRDPGWVDATGENIIFSRPHYFTIRPNTNPPQAIIPDVDNRALRLLNLKTLASTTVMYNRDIRLSNLPAAGLRSSRSCRNLNWADSQTSKMPSGSTSCARPPKDDALALTLGEARAHCQAEGARLCESSELRSSGVAGHMTAWTRADCASCWQAHAKGICAANIKTFKTSDLVHGRTGFAQSWNSGQALEVADSATGGPATLCRPVDDGLTAAAPCCADVAVRTPILQSDN